MSVQPGPLESLRRLEELRLAATAPDWPLKSSRDIYEDSEAHRVAARNTSLQPAIDLIERLREQTGRDDHVIKTQAEEIKYLNQMLRDTGQGQGAIDAYVAQCEEVERLRNILGETVKQLETFDCGEGPEHNANVLHRWLREQVRELDASRAAMPDEVLKQLSIVKAELVNLRGGTDEQQRAVYRAEQAVLRLTGLLEE